MNRILLIISFSIVLLVSLIGCGGQESQVVKYEKAKKRAEKKIVELEKILKPIEALKRGNLSELPKDPDSLKKLSEKVDIHNIKKISDEVSKNMQKVFELKPKGYDDDYKQWVQQMKQKLEFSK